MLRVAISWLHAIFGALEQDKKYNTYMTRFQLILPVDSHNVTKNLTGRRMHVEGPQINQINRKTRICMACYRQNLTNWPGKSIICKKNTIGDGGSTALQLLTLMTLFTLFTL